LITLDDARLPAAAPASAAAQVAPLAGNFLRLALFITVFSGAIQITRPAPYEFLFALLGFACLLAGVRFHRPLVPMILLLLAWQIGGFVAAMPVLSDKDVLRFLFISAFLAVTALVFALVLADDTERRLRTLSAAFILAAVMAATLATVGFFGLIPGFGIFVLYDRAAGTFTDPNVFGPFLTLPLLLLMQRAIRERARLRDVVASAIIATGLLLSFSRGAWGQFLFSAALMVWLLYVTSDDAKARRRVLAFVAIGALVAGLLLLLLLSSENVQTLLAKRTSLLQEYDVGTSRARFNIQSKSIDELMDNPMGMGPWVFAYKYGLVSHNSYLGTMLNQGWLGGIAYVALVVLTLVVGLRCCRMRTPWQSPMIAIYACYFGFALQSFVIDTDHTRHYYLALGALWGLAAATFRFAREERAGAAEPRSVAGPSAGLLTPS
jgi:O-antigen ligase